MERQPQNPEFVNNLENFHPCKSCWVEFFIFIQILIEHSVSKHCRS